MTYEWLEAYCLQKTGVTKDFQEDWGAFRYLVGGKMFLMDGGDKQENPIITLKLEPLHGDLLRKQLDYVIPGYYMNKTHWNSIYRNGSMAEDTLKSLIDESYALVFSTLPKKVQRELAEAT